MILPALALAVSQAAEVAEDYRQLEAAEATAPAKPDPIDKRVEALRRIMEASRSPAVTPSTSPTPSYEWQPPELPKLPAAPVLPQSAGPLDFDRQLAEPAPYSAAPPPPPMSTATSFAWSAAGLALLAAIAFRERLAPTALRAWRRTLQTIRQRAALVICLGAALVLADRYVFDGFEFDQYFTGLHNAGWIALFGGIVSLIGIYHWIAGPPDPKI